MKVHSVKKRLTIFHSRPKSQSRTPDPEKYRTLYLPSLDLSAVMQYNVAKGLWMRHPEYFPGQDYRFAVTHNADTYYWQDQAEAMAYFNGIDNGSYTKLYRNLRTPIVW